MPEPDASAANRISPSSEPAANFQNPAIGVEFPGIDMHDAAWRHRVLADRLEYAQGRQAAAAWDVEGYLGGDIDGLVVRSEGERARDGSAGRVEAMYSHAFAAFWNAEIGARRDFGSGPNRNWLAVGLSGLAPYRIETRATAYLGPGGRTALYGQVEYEARITQRLVLTPQAEFVAYGRSDPARGIGAGVSTVSAGLRLRYEIDRRYAPYVGFELVSRFGRTAALARQSGERAVDPQVVAGLRLWF